MKILWAKWLWGLWDSLLRHIGTAMLTWGGLTVKNWDQLHSMWGDLGVAIICGAIVPTLANYLSAQGAPDVVEDPKEGNTKT